MLDCDLFSFFLRIKMKEPQSSEAFIAEQKRILAENPECATSSYNMGVALMQQGKLDEAIEAFNEAIANSGRMFEGYVNLGYIYFKKGDLEKVVEVNKKAIEIEPRYARGYANLGFAYLQMTRTDEAIQALEKGIELNPEIAHHWAHRFDFTILLNTSQELSFGIMRTLIVNLWHVQIALLKKF